MAPKSASATDAALADRDAKGAWHMQPRWWWCLRHGRVEEDAGCPNTERLGPYDSPEQAAGALQRAQQRNEEWEAADREWDEGG